MAHQVFISYSHLDNQIAHALCDKLETDGTKCWIAPRDIAPGKSWAGEIAGAIPRSKIMILILSKSADSSKQVLREVEIAVHYNLIIIPVRIEDIMPTGGMSYYLATMQWIDVKGDKIDSKLAMISKKVTNILSELEDDEETDKEIDEDIKDDIKVDSKDETVLSKRKSGKKTVWIIVIAVVLAAAAGLTLFLMRDMIFNQKDDVPDTAPSTQTSEPTAAQPTDTVSPAPEVIAAPTPSPTPTYTFAPTPTATSKPTSTPTATSAPAPTPTPTPSELYISDLTLTPGSASILYVSWNGFNSSSNSYAYDYTVHYKPVDEEEYKSVSTIFAFTVLSSLLPNTEYIVEVSTKDGQTVSDTIIMPTPTPTPVPTPTPRSEYSPEDFGFDPNMEVEIPDSTLEDAIVETLESIGAPAEGELTVADMFNLEELCISNSSRPDQVQRVIDDKIIDNDVQISTTKAVSNIEGIQYAKNLKTLIIQRDGIVNISPISELSRLQILWLGGRYIKSLDALAGLTNISYLLITDTQYISDISAISNLENLTFLGLDWSKLTDISPIMNLSNVIDLAINNNTGLNDLSYLEGSPLIENLEGLWIPGCNISDLSFLSGAEKLRVLCLSDPSVKSDHEDISVLEDLNLDELIVSTRTYTDNIETIAKLISKGCNVSIDE